MSDATVAETWLYAGRRQGKGGRIIHAWIDESGAELYYAKIAGAAIGSAYRIDADRTDGTVTVIGSPSYLNTDGAEQGDVERWRAADAAVGYAKAAAAAEKRAAADGELEDALDVLRRYQSRLRTYAEQHAFAQWVAAEVGRPSRNET